MPPPNRSPFGRCAAGVPQNAALPASAQYDVWEWKSVTDIIRQSRGQCHCLRVQRGTLSHFTLRPHMRRGDAALLCRRTVARRATAHGVGTAALRQPGQTAGAGSGGKPLPRKAGPPPRVGPPVTRRPPGPLPTGLGLPPAARRGRRPRGVGTAALRQPGQTAGAGSGGKPLPRKAGLSPV